MAWMRGWTLSRQHLRLEIALREKFCFEFRLSHIFVNIHAAAPLQHIFSFLCGIKVDWDFDKENKNFFCNKRPRWDCERGTENDILCLSRFIFSVSPQTKLKKAENFSLKTSGSFVKDVSNFNECCGIYGVEGNYDGSRMASWGEKRLFLGWKESNK